MVRAVSCVTLALAAAAAVLLTLVAAVFMPVVAEESIYEATGN